ncbi:MAG: transposase, partial [Idiomarinaceae bacterium]|uniref:IS66 family transposase n=1 Tax=Idiomarina sp. 28-8 TaxID=1260624 RepID=UPI00055793D5
MKTSDIKQLPDDVESLQKMVLELQSEREKLQTEMALEEQRWQQKIRYMMEQWQLSLQKRFGASSEGLPGQGELFNELEDALEPTADEVAEDQSQTITYTRQKPRRPRIDESLPREEVLHDIPDEDKVCDCCGHDLHRMGEETSEELEFIPASIKVLRHVRPKYSCRACEKHGTETAVKIAPVQPSIMPKSIATPSLLAQIISAKFQFGLPLYRQEAMFKQYGIELSRQTMSRWMLTVSEKLRPLYQRMRDILLKQP